jgi:hypothetical protein
VSLEDSQQMQNRVITAIGNNSASNDFRQHKHDMNGKLIASAEAFAAGKKLGMSEEETLSMMSRMMRRQQRSDENVTANDIERQLAQSANSLADVSSGAELQGLRIREKPEVDPFGQMQDEFQEFGGRQGTAAAREEMVNLGMIDGNNLSEDERIRRGDAIERPQSGQAGVRDALTQLRGAREEQKGLSAMISRVMGGGDERMQGAAEVEGRLEDSLEYGPTQRGAERSLAAELVRRDNDRFSYRRGAYNNIKGQIEAEQIGERLYMSPRPGYETSAMVGDMNLDRIGSGSYQTPLPEAVPGPGGVFLDPSTGNPLAVQGPEFSSPNLDQSAQFNAPTTTRSWMVEQQPDYYQSQRSFGNYPQVDISSTTRLFADRLRGMPGMKDRVPESNYRSADELQTAVDFMAGKGDVDFATRELVTDPSGNVSLQSTTQTNPDIRGLLGAMRYTPAEEKQLANAMYQMEVARGTTVNQQGKQQYFTRTGRGGTLEPVAFQSTPSNGGPSIFFDSPEAIDPREGQAKVARIAPGQKIDGLDIKTALSKLGDPDAAKPFMGAVERIDPSTGKRSLERDAGPAYKTRYNKTGADDLVGIESALRGQEQEFAYNRARSAAKKNPRAIVRPADQQPVDEDELRGKVVKAALVSEREKRNNSRRANQMSDIISMLPPNARRTRLRG